MPAPAASFLSSHAVSYHINYLPPIHPLTINHHSQPNANPIPPPSNTFRLNLHALDMFPAPTPPPPPRLRPHLIEILATQFLQGNPFRFGNTQCGEDTGEHKDGVDLQDVVEPRASRFGRRASDAERRDRRLSDYGSNFPHARGEAVRGRAVAGGETFAGYDEGCGVRAWAGWGS